MAAAMAIPRPPGSMPSPPSGWPLRGVCKYYIGCVSLMSAAAAAARSQPMGLGGR